MPAVNAIPETVFPGATRRHVWAYPDVTSHSLVVLTFDRLYVTPLAGEPDPDLVLAIGAGEDLTAALPQAVCVELATVRGAKHDLLTNTLVFEYASGSGTEVLTVTFATPETADACYTKTWHRLGGDFKLRPYKRDARDAARAPLLALLTVFVLTAALALTISVQEDTASARVAEYRHAVEQAGADGPAVAPPRVDRPLGWLGWRGVCALGGIAAAGAQVWLYRRLTRPPVSLELVRTGPKLAQEA